ncbi:MAG: DNA polymerase domain-containing protein [Polyangia bacterium]
MSRQGFLIQGSFRLVAGQPVLHLYGRLADGSTFLVRESRERPYFFVRTADAERAAALAGGALALLPTARRTLAGEPVSRVTLPTPSLAAVLSGRLIAAGVPTYEADLNLIARYLIDRGLRGSVEIHGPARAARSPDERVDVVFDDPEVTPGTLVPELKAVALRVRPGPDGGVQQVALAWRGGQVVLRRGPGAGPGPGTAAGASPDTQDFPSERALLLGLVHRLLELDPDVLVGWDVVLGDLALLKAAARRLRVSLVLGRGPGDLQVHGGHAGAASTGRSGPARAVLSGRVVLDLPQLLRSAGSPLADESLEALCGRAEVSAETSPDEPLRTEARVAYDLLDQQGLLALQVQRSRLSGLPLDRGHASVAAFDLLYLMELGRRGVVAPTFEHPEAGEPVIGGHIVPPVVGLHRGVLVFDFKSLYPSLIRTFQIDPLGLLPTVPAAGETEAGVLVAPSGARFRRQLGVLTVVLDQLFPLRAAAKAAGEQARSQAIKLLMNSLYGVLGSPACRFHRPELANAVTSFGRALLRWCEERMQGYGHRVLYGDTDSLFVLAGPGVDPDDAAGLRRLGQELSRRITADLAAYVQATWQVESRLDLQLQTVYLRLLLTRLRSGKGDAGAAKRYAGLVEDPTSPGQRRVVLVGLEAVRRDSTDLARETQRALFERLFSDRPAAERASDVADYLQRVVARLRRGDLDDKLVYRRALRRGLDDYSDRAAPPHVAVARAQQAAGLAPGPIVRYVITRAGPEPAAGRKSPLDYDHYVEKQLRVVAQPVLAELGLDFDRAVGRDRQLKLFP